MKKLLPFILFVTFTVTVFSQTTYTVNSVDDLPDSNINDTVCADVNGNCTLRAAIENANKTNDKDTIVFNITGTGPFTIRITSRMLPEIMRPVIIDGRTQPGYISAPVIEIEGSDVPLGGAGLRLFGRSDNSEIYSLCIGGFLDVGAGYAGGLGIDVKSQRTIMRGNYIGLKPDGTTLNRNQWGVFFKDSGNNVFGGTGANEGNVVSGNYSGGVTFSGVGSSNNIIQGNLLGTDATGLLPRGNRFNLQILNAPNNTVGGSTPAARNILSAGENIQTEQMDGTGISMTGVNSTNNKIIGNYIGTDITGTKALPNVRGGILVLFGASNNSIGSDVVGEGNLISGNERYGIYFQGGTTGAVDSNSIKGNLIGVDVTGNVALPNQIGIMFLTAENNNNVIGGTTVNARNIVSGNDIGIGIANGQNNQILGNYVGTNMSGTAAIPNRTGVTITDGNNTIGGPTAGSRNVISGNTTGVSIYDNASSGSKIIGNYIGLNAAGNAGLPNVTGVTLDNSSGEITVGGPNPLDRNIISGNTKTGIDISGSGHIIQNNYIGLNPSGNGVIKNGNYGMMLVGVLEGSRVYENTISGNGTISNSSRNVYLFNANGVRFYKNRVGTLPDGMTGVVNVGGGVVLQSSRNNVIGGETALDGNIIGYHDTDAVSFVMSSFNNVLRHNKIGVGADGITDLGNVRFGVAVFTNSGDNSSNTIAQNIIANNNKGLYLDAATGVKTQFAISENSIYNNTVKGIELYGNTGNDVGDADTGANNFQNSPEVSAIKFLGGNSIEITFEVTSTTTNSAYPLLIEFFGAANGQGKSFIDSYSYTAPGVQTITINLPSGYDPADYENIVATATDANGNTSEFGVNVSYTLSVSQFENQMVRIYPNPVTDKLFIQSPSSRNFNLKLVNSLGQLVMSQESNSASAELNLSSLSSGLYFLNIADDNKNSQTIKIIKN